MENQGKSDLPPLIGAIGAVLGLLDKFFKLPITIPGGEVGRAIVLLASFALLLYWWSTRTPHMSRIAKPRLLEESAENEGDLFGRQGDITKLSQAIAHARQVFVVGESGIGKTAILVAGLKQKLAQLNIHPVYIESLGPDDGDTVMSAVREAFAASLAADQRAAIVPDSESCDAAALLTEFKKVSGLTPLLIFDAFETYMRANRSVLRADATKTWIAPADLAQLSPSWNTLKRLCDSGFIKLLIATRSDDASGLVSFAFSSPKTFELDRLTPSALIERLESITERGIVSEPEHGWTALRARLVDDLSPDGWVLPIQMVVALRGLAHMQGLSLKEYLRHGGLPGLEGSVIRSHIAAASRRSGLKETAVVALLSSLFDRKNGDATPRTIAELEGAVGKDAGEAISRACSYLEEARILRRRLLPGGGEVVWSLYHDYLHRGVLAAERSISRWASILKAHHRNYKENGGGIRSVWSSLLPPGILLVLLIKRVQRRLRFDEARRYVALSGIRFVPYALLALTPVVLADVGIIFPGASGIRYQMVLHNLALPRKPYETAAAHQYAHELSTEVGREISTRIDGYWTEYARGIREPHDVWATTQEICARFRDPATSPADAARNVQRLQHLFDPALIVKDGAKWYGWAVNDQNTYLRSEPLLWAGSAVALGLKRADVSPADKVALTDVLAKIFAMSALYYDKNTGGWYRFIKPVDQEAHSSYLAALAMAMLLDCREANVRLEFDGASVDDALARTLAWIRTHYDEENEAHGWREIPELKANYTISPPLTAQMYSVVLRARRDVGGFIPDVLPNIIKSNLRAQLLKSVENEEPDFSAKLNARFIHPVTQKPQFFESNIDFLWLPWAVECARLALASDEVFNWSAEEKNVLRYNLGTLVLNHAPKYWSRNKAGWTFRLSELLLVLSQC